MIPQSRYAMKSKSDIRPRFLFVKKKSRAMDAINRPSQSIRNLLQVVLLSLIILSTGTKGDASECYNCYSTDKEGCMDPYYGRYKYNSNILIPDCSYDMSRNFHTSLMYVLTRDTLETDISKIDQTYINKWDDLTRLQSFYCCKALFQVSIARELHRYVVRGCCCTPSSYDQCVETRLILKNLSDVTPRNTTYSLEHCSTCGSDRCNSSPTSVVHDVVLTTFAVLILKVAVQCWCNSVTNKFS